MQLTKKIETNTTTGGWGFSKAVLEFLKILYQFLNKFYHSTYKNALKIKNTKFLNNFSNSYNVFLHT